MFITYIDVHNIYMFVTYIYIYIYKIDVHNIGISNHEKHLRLLSSGTKLLLPLSLKVLRHKERDTHSFYSGFSICNSPPPHLVRHLPKASASKRKSTFFFGPARLQLKKLTFSKLPVHDVIHIHWSTFLSDFYLDIYERHILPVCALTSALKFAPN